MRTKTFAVLGLGNFGMGVADELMEKGAEVLVADIDEQLIEENASRYTQAVIADLSNVDEIRQLGLGNMDAVIVCMSQDLEASIMCVMVAKEEGAHRVIAKAENKRKSEVLKKVGADQIVFPEKESGTRVAFQLISGEILKFFELTGNLVVAEIKPRKDWYDKTLSELNLRNGYGINVLAIYQGDKVYEASRADTIVRSGDLLMVMTTKEKLEEFEN